MEPNIPPTQTSTTEPVPVTPIEPKKSLPKWPLIIVVVILLATLLTGTYLLGKNQGVNQKPASKTITVSPTPDPAQIIAKTTPTAAPANNNTATWKTYTNIKYPFSFRYPNTFTIAEVPNHFGDYSLLINLNDAQGVSDYSIEVLTSSKGLIGKAFIDSWFGQVEGGPSEIKSDNISSYTVYRFFMQKAGIKPAGSANIMFQSGPMVVIFSTAVKEGQANEIMNDNLLNELASTFKFTQ